MNQEYIEIKSKYRDCLVFYHIGGFFELFGEDAEIANQKLGLKLTSRSKNGEIMCGVPVDSANLYIGKLLKMGHKIALTKQAESSGKFIRNVVRVFTPATIIEDDFLGNDSNFLVSIASMQNLFAKEIGISWLDISVGEFFTKQINILDLKNFLAKISPTEILLDSSLAKNDYISKILENQNSLVTTIDKGDISEEKLCNLIMDSAYGNLSKKFSNSQNLSIQIIAEYIANHYKNNSIKLPIPMEYSQTSSMQIDAEAIRSLELIRQYDFSTKFSLLNIIDKTKTAHGFRLLKEYLLSPLASIDEINERLDRVAFFVNYFKENPYSIGNFDSILQKICDVKRLMTRIMIFKTNLADLSKIKTSFDAAGNLERTFNSMTKKSDNILEIPPFDISFSSNINEYLNSAIEEKIADNEIILKISENFDPALDEFHKDKKQILDEIRKLEIKYKSETSVTSLKIVGNNGYFIEVNTKFSESFDNRIFRYAKSIGSNMVRYKSDELDRLEYKLIAIGEKISNLENEIIERIRKKLIASHDEITRIFNNLARLDVVLSFAKLTIEKGYIRPKFTNHEKISIKSSTHPVMEEIARKTSREVVKNDFEFDDCKIWLITGANMSGKSTILKQLATIIIMAHIGSFIPAFEAEICIIDKIFTRIGSNDDIAKNASTFMNEMRDVSNILNNATSRSLAIMDEVGRGTSVTDGMAIAFGSLKYLHNHNRCFALFSTHYNNLPEFTKDLPLIKNKKMAVKKIDNEIKFDYKIENGISEKSFGINIAKIAGMPESALVYVEGFSG